MITPIVIRRSTYSRSRSLRRSPLPQLPQAPRHLADHAKLEEAWNALLAVAPTGWYIGRPSYHDERGEWLLYVFDPSERPVVGVRSREWIAKATTELGPAADG